MTCLSNSIIFFLLLLLLPPPASTREPYCPKRCGNVSFSYPFGVGSDCSLEKSFNITCIDSKPYVHNWNVNIEVVEINPTQIRIKYPYFTFGACFNVHSGDRTRRSDWFKFDFSDGQYSLSEDNWLTGIGCDDFLVSKSFVGNASFSDACLSFCSQGNSTGSGHCPMDGDKNSAGEGCCRTPIPKGTSVLSANLLDLTKTWNRTRVFPCSYAFVNEKQSSDENPQYSYNYSVLLEYATPFVEEEKKPVVRLDWRISNQNCSEAKWNPSYYVCQDNTDCVDFGAEIGGYLCNCSEGYEGNPYLHPGCTDINECLVNPNPCGPYSTCKNTPAGNYSCPCQKGYTGDGRPGASGCEGSNHIIQIVIIGLSSALGLLLLLLLGFWLHKVFDKIKDRKRKEDLFKHILLQQQTIEGTFGKTKLFTAKELAKATDGFNESRVCGKGGQGIVYKGMISDGTIVAIKKLREVDKNQVEHFINEVVILSLINHKNVVKLLGCCLAKDDPQLVYEFLPNGTLFDLIHDPKPEFPLTWNMRLKIAADVAGALAYLHHTSSVPIYHRDIKSTNILLDDKYIVKVSDFGLSKRVEVDKTHLTTMVRGTFGYLDPEYYETSQYTEKSDVYSFGVILVELLTGRQAIFTERPGMQRNSATLFIASMEENNLNAILDARVSEDGAKEEVTAVARLAKRCLNMKGKMRPTMREVAIELESFSISQQPSTYIDEEHEEATVFRGKHMMVSDVEYTWTVSDSSIATSSLSDTHPLMS